LSLDSENPQYLSEKLELYLDDQLTDSLFIGKDLKGSATTQIQISGSGTGTTREEAYNDAVESMKQLQTVLKTGSLPFKLKIEKLELEPESTYNFEEVFNDIVRRWSRYFYRRSFF